MKIIKIIAKIAGLVLVLLLVGVSLYLYTSGPALPAEAEGVIENVLLNSPPELVRGTTGIVDAHGVNIWYESISPKDSPKGAILLIMGISNDALGWPPKFIKTFVDSGYRVIRYDHRGTGMSDWMEDWDSDNPYSLTDMADDGIAVLNSLGVQKAHVIGISMGGMIAQELAIHHPDRITSLTSMMSSGYIEDPNLPAISSDIAIELIKVALKYGVIGGEENMIKLHLASRIILMGNAVYKVNVKEIAEQVLFNIRMRKGYNTNVSKQHQAAVLLSGSRYDKLKNISVPTLVIHGKSDPFIPIEHGMKCASIIPDADSLWVDNMGHDIPDDIMDTISGRIIANFSRVLR